MFGEIVSTKTETAVSPGDVTSVFFVFEERHYRLVGKRSGKVYRLGDPVRIKVKNTNLEQRLLDFELLDPGTAEPQDRTPVKGDKTARKAKIKAAIQASKKAKKRK